MVLTTEKLFLPSGRPLGAGMSGGRREPGGPPYPCCSFGGCGYEDKPQFLAPIPVDHRTMAVAGFSESEFNITHQPNLLIVSGDRPEEAGEYLHRGLPGTSFERRFELADHVKIANATLQN